jgi:hypothetical protein
MMTEAEVSALWERVKKRSKSYLEEGEEWEGVYFRFVNLHRGRATFELAHYDSDTWSIKLPILILSIVKTADSVLDLSFGNEIAIFDDDFELLKEEYSEISIKLSRRGEADLELIYQYEREDY